MLAVQARLLLKEFPYELQPRPVLLSITGHAWILDLDALRRHNEILFHPVGRCQSRTNRVRRATYWRQFPA